MPRHLLIRLAPDGSAAWCAVERDGRPLHGERAGLPPAAEEIASLTVLVPAEDVLVLPLPELPGSARQRLQALPFAIEEQLAAPVEQQHVAVSADPPLVLVVARARLEGWLAQLAAAGLAPDRMLPDACLVPSAPATVVLHGGRALLRPAADRVLAVPACDLAQYLAVLGGAASGPVHVLDADDGATGAPDGVAVAARQRAPDLLAALAPQVSGTTAVQLLQGSFAPAHRTAGSRRSWSWAAALGGLALLLALSHAVLEYRALEARWHAQQAEMQALYRSVAPGSAPVPDPAARLRSLLERRGAAAGAEGALALLARVAPALSGSGRYTVDAVEYRGGALELTLRAPDVATLDALRARLSAEPPLQAELTGLVPGSNGVEGRLRVRGGPA